MASDNTVRCINCRREIVYRPVEDCDWIHLPFTIVRKSSEVKVKGFYACFPQTQQIKTGKLSESIYRQHVDGSMFKTDPEREYYACERATGPTSILRKK